MKVLAVLAAKVCLSIRKHEAKEKIYLKRNFLLASCKNMNRCCSASTIFQPLFCWIFAWWFCCNYLKTWQI